jgi:sRNA-binding regulator protein Hfq
MTKRIAGNALVEARSSLAAVIDAPIEDAPIEIETKTALPGRRSRALPVGSAPKRFIATHLDEHAVNRQAELFYLQKQIQLQTQMIFVLEDGARIQGVVEWYDRQSIKVRGKSRVLIYKSAIKYLYKAGEIGSAPSE